MQFTEAEDKAFWPDYCSRDDVELSKVNDERVGTYRTSTVKNYSRSLMRLLTSWH